MIELQILHGMENVAETFIKALAEILKTLSDHKWNKNGEMEIAKMMQTAFKDPGNTTVSVANFSPDSPSGQYAEFIASLEKQGLWYLPMKDEATGELKIFFKTEDFDKYKAIANEKNAKYQTESIKLDEFTPYRKVYQER